MYLLATATWPHTRLCVLRFAIAGKLRVQAAGNAREWLQCGACSSFASAFCTPVSLLPTTAAAILHPGPGCTNLPHCPLPAGLQSSLKEVLENIEQTRTVWHMQVGLPSCHGCS